MIHRLVFALLLASIASTIAHGETKRQMGAHVHGHGRLNMAVEDKILQMELEVPGADIVGFEHAASSKEDKATIAAAMEKLKRPEELFILPEAAGCKVTSADVHLEGHGSHGESKHEEHEHGTHEKVEEHQEDSAHSEFHATYTFDCSNVGAISTVALPFFEIFANSQELEVMLLTENGQKAFEVNREQARIDLQEMM